MKKAKYFISTEILELQSTTLQRNKDYIREMHFGFSVLYELGFDRTQSKTTCVKPTVHVNVMQTYEI